MSLTLKPYPEYKDSGLPWLGEIPAHWEVKRLKRVARINPSKAEARDVLDRGDSVAFLPMEKVSTSGEIDARGILPVASVWNGFTYFRKGDVLLAKITPCFENGKGACLDSLPTAVGFGSTEFIVMRANKEIRPRFLYRVTTLSEFRTLGTDDMTGSAGQQRVPPAFVGNFVSAIPPLSEQDRIIDFLDRADQIVNQLIRAKQRLIELLTEQKQASIHQAVTRGLDTDIPMKPTGLDWLPEVPEHWEILRSKYIFREIDARSATGLETHLSMSQRLGLVPHSQIQGHTYVSESYVGAKICEKNDLVLNRLKAHLGVFSLAPERGLVSPDYTVFRPIRSICDLYFEMILRTPACRVELRQRTKGIVEGLWRLYTDDFYQIQLPVPPESEQHQILEQLTYDIQRIEGTIKRAQREIELIREYRTRLISDVVTGKLDVRGVDLPEAEMNGEGVENAPVRLEYIATKTAPYTEET